MGSVLRRNDIVGFGGAAAEDGMPSRSPARMARAEDGVVTEGFEHCGNGGAEFTGAEDGDVHGVDLSRELGPKREWTGDARVQTRKCVSDTSIRKLD
jgi:hypothetical protein